MFEFGAYLVTKQMEQVLREIQEEARLREAEIQAFLDSHPELTPNDLLIEHCYFPKRFKVRAITPAERWINWQSANHGWEQSRDDN